MKRLHREKNLNSLVHKYKENTSYSATMFGNTNVEFKRKIKGRAIYYPLFSPVLGKVSDRLHILADLTPLPIEGKDGVSQCP
jgi:hypothetical protein